MELGRAPKRLSRVADRAAFGQAVARSVTPLWSDPNLSEQAMQLGKVQNLRRAAAALDGVVLAPGAVFSFWRQVGRATQGRGFVPGRMLREGCMMPAIGGGLCQLSNALYDVALQAGCRILERHAHSFRVPGSAAAEGRDATVAWNYVDLRFAAETELVLSVRLSRRDLNVSLLARGGPVRAPAAIDAAPPLAFAPDPEVENCGACDQVSCAFHEHGARGAKPIAGRAAFVVDEAWPELAAYIAERRQADDVLLAPSLRRWSREGFAEAHQARLRVAMRSLGWRLTPPQGAARRSADATSTQAIARALARRLAPEVTELTVAQSLLPQLWREGVLGGRSVRVLMTRLPIVTLQARLDALAKAHPDRPTLADYRADPWLAEAETEALAAADEIVTPHAEIAALFGERAVLLDWKRPKASRPRPVRCGDVFAFPGPTVARKGAFEVREAARRLGAKLRPVGAELEGEGFWTGVEIERAPPDGAWLDGVRAVVHPALAEGAPRRLLEALAAGVPVIATTACGLAPQPGLTLVPMDDIDALTAAMAAVSSATA